MPVISNPIANLIENPLKRDKDTEEEGATMTTAVEDNETLLAEDGDDVDSMLEDFEKAQFRHEYAQKLWPYRLLKFMNWFLLLCLIVPNCLSAMNGLGWSQLWWQPIFASRPSQNLGFVSAAAEIVLLALITISMLGHCCIAKRVANNSRKTFWAAFFALMDMCLWAFAVPILLFAAIFFTLCTISEYMWYLPGAKNVSSLLEMRDYSYYGYSYIPRRLQQQIEMPKRQNQMYTRLIADPLIAIFSTLAIPVSIALFVSVRRMMKRANLCGSSLSPVTCTQFDAEYSRHFPYKMLLAMKWFCPFVALGVLCYIPSFYDNLTNYESLTFIPIIACHFALWLFYSTKMHFPKSQCQLQPMIGVGDRQKADKTTTVPRQQRHRLFALFLADTILAICSTLAIYHFTASKHDYPYYQLPFFVHYPLLVLYLFSAIVNLLLFVRTIINGKNGPKLGGGRLLANLPSISIQINVQVVKKEKEEKQPTAVKTPIDELTDDKKDEDGGKAKESAETLAPGV